MKRNIFNASFEDSQKIFSNSLTKSYREWQDNEKSREVGLVGTIIFFIIILSPLFFISLIANHISSEGNPSYYPLWLCVLIIVIFLIITYGRGLMYGGNYNVFYNGQFSLAMILIIYDISLNLFIFSAFSKYVSIYFIVFIILSSILFLIFLTRSRIRYTVEILHSENHNDVKNFFEKLIISLPKIFSVILVVSFFITLIIPNDISIGLYSSAIMYLTLLIVINFVIILFLDYITFPFIIQQKYLNKYSEEYRKLKKVTQLEWYGEKYFNKYIKGTKKEEKENE
ncbi:hypothetical protein BG262_05800 [Floricoccus penangensis]|uniref:Beta-carotene 15,15'-monooxygenase n=1 Tax=Floricoccus penangensis TaxID=1859475 RepID=A0A9Q5NYX7_9LACT|nr:hypothetical protein [Floricoccus penangensis]OFI45997.1 hypothetical protein BG262_05800 [Floricoccus penangensis]